MLRDGSLEVKGNNKPDLATKENSEMLADLEASFDVPKFEKPDYFASFPMVEGVVSAEEFRRRGMQIHGLKE